MKRCPNCFQEKPESEFFPRRVGAKVRLQSRCRACNVEVVAGWRKRNVNALMEQGYPLALAKAAAKIGMKRYRELLAFEAERANGR
jgi:hypothetical protein